MSLVCVKDKEQTAWRKILKKIIDQMIFNVYILIFMGNSMESLQGYLLAEHGRPVGSPCSAIWLTAVSQLADHARPTNTPASLFEVIVFSLICKSGRAHPFNRFFHPLKGVKSVWILGGIPLAVLFIYPTFAPCY